jgi:hypothetical protein
MATTTITNPQIAPINFERFRGDTIEIPFQLTIGSTALKISDCSAIVFTLKARRGDSVNILQKTKGAGISTFDDTTGKGVVRIETGESPAQTLDTTYYYDIQVTEVANNSRVTTVMWGSLILTNDITK